jgi:hypothetical protein
MLNQKLQLLDPILDPVESHVDALRKLRNHGALGQTDGALIVTQNERGRLRVAEVVENAAFDVADFCGGK